MISTEFQNVLFAILREDTAALIAEWTQYFDEAEHAQQHRYYADFLAFFEECVQQGLDPESESAQAMINYLVKLSEIVGEDRFYRFRDSVYTCYLKFPVLGQVDRHGAFILENALALTRFFESLTSNLMTHYIQRRRDREEAAETELHEREAPMGEIWDGVLLVTLVGSIDSHRILIVIDKVLDRMDNTGMRHVIIDIGSVADINSEVTNQLLKLNSAVHFMGARAYMSGITPTIAKSLTHLDIHLGDVRTFASSRDALQEIIGRTDR